MNNPKMIEIENLQWQKASPNELDQLNYYSNHETKVPSIYFSILKVGYMFMFAVVVLAAWTAVFLKEISLYLLPVFQFTWKLAVIFAILVSIFYLIIRYWYHHKTLDFKVAYVRCTDIQYDENQDRYVAVFLSENNEKFMLFKDEFAYIPESFSVYVDYVIATDDITNQYYIFQRKE